MVEKSSVIVPVEWSEFIYSIVNVLDSDIPVHLKILRPIHNQQIPSNGILGETQSQTGALKPVEIPVPHYYAQSIRFLVSQLKTLKSGQKIVVIPYKKTNLCVFCGQNKLSKEHIIPRWLLSHFQGHEFTPTTMIATDLEEFNMLEAIKTPISEAHKTKAITSGVVCEDCNSGWMAQLENEVKNIFTAENGTLSQTLNVDGDVAEKITRWLLKMALLFSYELAGSNAEIFPKDFYAGIKDGALPLGIATEIGKLPSKGLNFEFSTRPIGYLLENLSVQDAKQISEGYFCFCLQIGEVVFRLSHLPYDHVLQRVGDRKIGEMNLCYTNMANIAYIESDAAEQTLDALDKSRVDSFYLIAKSLFLSDKLEYMDATLDG
ncbi:MAG: hypothetical protein WDZ49_00500 [Litorilinea sp.]